jgi:starvation-inducible outer membrane lipoprotein
VRKAVFIAAFSFIIAGCADLDKQISFKDINEIPDVITHPLGFSGAAVRL